MSYTVQQLLALSAHFEKIAVDVPQSPDFDEDYKKYQEMVNPTPKDDEGAYEKWLKDKGTLDQDIPVEMVEEPLVHSSKAIDDLSKYEKQDADTYIRTAAKKQEKSQHEGLGKARREHEEWAKKNPRMSEWSDKDWSNYLKLQKDSNSAKDKKLDPKAKVRNRGTVCVPAEQAKDKKDHFPINDEGQARSALSRVEGLTSAPWYNGTLEGLRTLVKRKVHSKYPSIGKDKSTKKKASLEAIDAMLYEYNEE
jgi:hypothetical protein